MTFSAHQLGNDLCAGVLIYLEFSYPTPTTDDHFFITEGSYSN